MENKVIEDISYMKSEIKNISSTLLKMEKVFEWFSWLIEKQNIANHRIFNLEENEKILRNRVRKLEDWQIKIITIATVIATIFWFILNKYFNFYE